MFGSLEKKDRGETYPRLASSIRGKPSGAEHGFVVGVWEPARNVARSTDGE
jgi:hypothetical protein